MKRFSKVLFVLGAMSLASAPSASALGGKASTLASGDMARVSVMVLGTRGSACSGTLVAADVVLTAAHCVEGSKELAIAWIDKGQARLVPVTGVAKHPQSRTGSAVSVDLALVRLAERLPARFLTAPIDEGASPHALGQTQILAGYGMSEDGVEASAGTLREANIRVLGPLLPRFMRLGVEGGGMEAFRLCVGDSGGGVFNEAGVLVAVIAQRERQFGGTTCAPVAQAVRTAPQIEWIRGAMRKFGH